MGTPQASAVAAALVATAATLASLPPPTHAQTRGDRPPSAAASTASSTTSTAFSTTSTASSTTSTASSATSTAFSATATASSTTSTAFSATATAPAATAAAPAATATAAATARLDCSPRRLEELRALATTARRHTSIWSYTWAGIHASILTTNLVLSQTLSGEQRSDYYFAVGGASLGVLAALMGPSRELRRLSRAVAQLRAAERAQRHDGAGAEAAEAERCTAIAAASRELAEVAKMEAFAKSWVVYIGNVVINGTLGVGLGAGLGRWRSAFIQSVGGIAIGHIMTLTRPATTMRGLGRLELAPFTAGAAGPTAGVSAVVRF